MFSTEDAGYPLNFMKTAFIIVGIILEVLAAFIFPIGQPLGLAFFMASFIVP